MKQIYLTLFFLFALIANGQDHIQISDTTEPASEEVKLYPNPTTSNTIYITSKTNSTKHIFAYDVFGAVVLQETITGKALDISSLVSGVYVLKIKENNTTVTRKLVVR